MSAPGSGALLDRGVAERTAAATVAGLGRLGSRSPAPDALPRGGGPGSLRGGDRRRRAALRSRADRQRRPRQS